MEAQLTALQLPYRRMPAWSPADVTKRFSMINIVSVPPISVQENACLASHLDAIHEAVHDPDLHKTFYHHMYTYDGKRPYVFHHSSLKRWRNIGCVGGNATL